MKKIIATILFLPYFASACITPTGDPWFVANSKIDLSTIPAGINISVIKNNQLVGSPAPASRFSSTVLLNSSNTPLLFLVAEGESSLQEKYFFLPPELKEINDMSFNKLKAYGVLIKVQDGKTYRWGTDPSSGELVSTNFGKDIVYKNFQWNELENGYALDEQVLNVKGIKTPNCDDVKSPYHCFSIKALNKRPSNITTPDPQSFSIPAYFGKNKFEINGQLTYDLTPNYKPLQNNSGCGGGFLKLDFYWLTFLASFAIILAVAATYLFRIVRNKKV